MYLFGSIGPVILNYIVRMTEKTGQISVHKLQLVATIRILCFSRELGGRRARAAAMRFAITNTGKLRLDLYESHNQSTTAIGSTTITTGGWHNVAENECTQS